MGKHRFAWTAPTRSVEDALEDAFPGGKGWQSVHFAEGSGSVTWTMERVAKWVKEELLGNRNPFWRHGDKVPVPVNTEFDTGDQLGPRHWVGYSRRQICFIVAKSLLGAGTEGYKNGLLRFLEKKTKHGVSRKGDFGRSWWGLLAACAADPLMENGQQGPQLLVAKAEEYSEVSVVRELAKRVSCGDASLRVCRYDDGGNGTLPSESTEVPEGGCRQPAAGYPGNDFMAGGLAGQATHDISAAWLGGYVFGNAAGLGGGQDERLMVYFPEVSALSFFLSQDSKQPEAPQLRQPVWILGARRLFQGIDGTCRYNSPPILDPAVPMTSDLLTVELNGRRYRMSRSRPFLAFMSENQGFITDPKGPKLDRAMHLIRRNKEPRQRNVDPNSKWSFEKQVRAWYRAVALSSYPDHVQPILKAIVSSVGAGPWLAGLWFGDSQLGFLASLLGHAIAVGSWGGARKLPLDYYIYSAFTENPGNQCFVHAKALCHACLARCAEAPLPNESFWLPRNAYFGNSSSKSCVPDKSSDCGEKGFADVLRAYKSKPASALWDDLEAALRESQGDTSMTVFDLLLHTSDHATSAP